MPSLDKHHQIYLPNTILLISLTMWPQLIYFLIFACLFGFKNSQAFILIRSHFYYLPAQSSSSFFTLHSDIIFFPIVTLGCGAKISENCTYFQSASSSQSAGQCGVTICKCSSDICQVLDISYISLYK